jgi:hypothetical protein
LGKLENSPHYIIVFQYPGLIFRPRKQSVIHVVCFVVQVTETKYDMIWFLDPKIEVKDTEAQYNLDWFLDPKNSVNMMEYNTA